MAAAALGGSLRSIWLQHASIARLKLATCRLLRPQGRQSSSSASSSWQVRPNISPELPRRYEIPGVHGSAGTWAATPHCLIDLSQVMVLSLVLHWTFSAFSTNEPGGWPDSHPFLKSSLLSACAGVVVAPARIASAPAISTIELRISLRLSGPNQQGS